MQAPSLEARLRNIVEALTFDVYNYTCLSLFECHKLMFSFQVTAAASLATACTASLLARRMLQGQPSRVPAASDAPMQLAAMHLSAAVLVKELLEGGMLESMLLSNCSRFGQLSMTGCPGMCR